MLVELINENLSSNFESNWFEFSNYDFVESKMKLANSLQISWNNVSGQSLDGSLKLIVSNDLNEECFGKEFIINSSSNMDNVVIVALLVQFKYFKFKFLKNSISDGKIHVSILYV